MCMPLMIVCPRVRLLHGWSVNSPILSCVSVPCRPSIVAKLCSTRNKSVVWSIVVIRLMLGEIIVKFMMGVIILVTIAMIINRRIALLLGFKGGFWMGISGPLSTPIAWLSVRHPFHCNASRISNGLPSHRLK